MVCNQKKFFYDLIATLDPVMLNIISDSNATPIYQTDKESIMVMRTIEIKEIKYEVDKERRGSVISRLKELYKDQLDIFTEGDFVGVRGDLHNYKRRNRILWIMSGGKHGKNLPTG